VGGRGCDGLARDIGRRTVREMRDVRVGDWVGVEGLGGRVEGPYKVRSLSGYDAEVVCVRTGRRMLVAVGDLRKNPGN